MSKLWIIGAALALLATPAAAGHVGGSPGGIGVGGVGVSIGAAPGGGVGIGGVGVSVSGFGGNGGNGSNGSNGGDGGAASGGGAGAGSQPGKSCWPWQMLDTWPDCPKKGGGAYNRETEGPNKTAAAVSEPELPVTKGDLAAAMAPLERDVEGLRRQIEELFNNSLRKE